MGRPKKSERDAASTQELLFRKALELFALRGFDAVSVRDITGSLGLNEATLYIHYSSKAALLDAIFSRLEKSLINPGFKVPPPEVFKGAGAFDPADFLLEGAERFFNQTDKETLLTWRLLMTSQFRYESARRSVKNHLLDTPVRFFSAILENMQAAGRIPSDVECRSAGRIIAALFFDYSFRANLNAAWGEESKGDFTHLAEDLRFFIRSQESKR
ncbi:MAG: TetR/AcrR family transcriptional regulator [Spirochaetales bacterium]|nr:TetR/AcrR family transcriptional regulator [Spirochaetales bacterium]MCF7938099.1 TetR/AcrR family transcriptional regulator [Spirochaetales bacterium]